MHTYSVERLIPASVHDVWEAISDITHYVLKDPYHDLMEWQSDHHTGIGAAFTCHHHFFPIFPFFPERVLCTITKWEAPVLQELHEESSAFWKSHTQRFILSAKESQTRLRYEVDYYGIPWWFLLYRVYIDVMVIHRMRAKCWEVEQTVLRKPFQNHTHCEEKHIKNSM